MFILRAAALAAVSAFALTACSGVDFAPPMGSSGASSSQASSGSGSSSTMTVADQSFIAQAAYGSWGEIALGKLAQQQGASSAVRDLGQRMVTEHTRANEELAKLAQAKGVTPPTAPDPGRQAVSESMMQLRGANFDRQYLQQQLADHEVSIALFDAQSRNGTDPQLRSFATKWLPALQDHARHIRSLGSNMARLSQ